VAVQEGAKQSQCRIEDDEEGEDEEDDEGEDIVVTHCPNA
jgi:hypothetical protein